MIKKIIKCPINLLIAKNGKDIIGIGVAIKTKHPKGWIVKPIVSHDVKEDLEIVFKDFLDLIKDNQEKI